VKPILSVGRKFISLLACSILKVYNGVLDGEDRAVTAVIAQNAITKLAATISVHFCFLSMLPPPLHFVYSLINTYIKVSIYLIYLNRY
jgi:hypothetical protein